MRDHFSQREKSIKLPAAPKSMRALIVIILCSENTRTVILGLENENRNENTHRTV